MVEKVEVFFKQLLAAFQTLKFYGAQHPMFKKSVEKAYASLEEIAKQREELVIGVVGEELAFENEILFDLSKMVKPTILYLKDRGIERMVFYRNVRKEELEKFIDLLAIHKDEIKKEMQEYLLSAGIKNIAVGRLKIGGTSSPAADSSSKAYSELGIPRLNYANLYKDSLDQTSASMTKILDGQEADVFALKLSINNIMENLETHYQEFLKLTVLKRYSLETYVHLLNVAILSMHFSSRLGMSRNDVLDIGVAALFHDIGKLYISRKVLGKTEKLTEDEFSQIKSHTVLGAEILLKYIDTLSILPIVVSFEHHLKYNMTGYPKVQHLQKLHIASLIVSICDVYDALSQRRGYKMDYSPDAIYNVMIKEKGTSFEPLLLENFFKVIGVWPIGSIVALSDASTAVIRDEHEDDILSPKVEVIYPEDKKRIIDLRQTIGTLKIERFLNPWKEGRNFLHLV